MGRPGAATGGQPFKGAVLIAISWIVVVVAVLLPFLAIIWLSTIMDADRLHWTAQLALGALLIVAALGFIMGSFAVAIRIYASGKGLRLRPLPALSTPGQPFILLLRTFADDGRQSHSPRLKLRLPLALTEPWKQLEFQIAEHCERVLPLVAVGDPRHRHLREGARRFYAADADWRVEVATALARCSAVLFVVGSGAGLQWEFRQAIRTVPHDRIGLVFPLMRPGRSWPFSLLPAGKGAARAEQQARYQAFAVRCARFGCRDLPASLDSRQVILFDDVPVLSGQQPRRNLRARWISAWIGSGILLAAIGGGSNLVPLLWIAAAWAGLIYEMRTSYHGSIQEGLDPLLARIKGGARPPDSR